jgi:hypothetical protein
MNNGMFVEMCAYIANRDMKKAQFELDLPENEPEPTLTGADPSFAPKAGWGLATFWYFCWHSMKALRQQLFSYVPKRYLKDRAIF